MHTKNVRLVSFNLGFQGFWTTYTNQISTEQGSRVHVSIKALFLVGIFKSVQFLKTQVRSCMLILSSSATLCACPCCFTSVSDGILIMIEQTMTCINHVCH